MTNLYELLNKILTAAKRSVPGAVPLGNSDKRFVALSDDEIAWIEQFLDQPDLQLHFKAKHVRNTPEGEPVYAQDFAIAGAPDTIFCMLTEAMLQNHQFADLLMMATSFYKEHVPKCPECSKRHFSGQKPKLDWTFSPHKPIDK